MAACVWASLAQPYLPAWESLDARPVAAWYLDAKFGIFIHWGVYSVPAWAPVGQYAEWYWYNMSGHDPKSEWWNHHRTTYGEAFDYRDFAPMFTASRFDPNEWAELFHQSGAKYVVPTAKHHDGFCLWPSAHANAAWGHPWNSVDAGPRRDLLGELLAAVRSRPGMKAGVYYSLYEWFNPLWLTNQDRFVQEHLPGQFRDLVTRYRPDLIFSDGEWSLRSDRWDTLGLLAWLFNEAPGGDTVVVNDRWGSETRHKHGGYYTTEYGAGLPDPSHPWEESRGMAYSYGLNRAEQASDYKSAHELITLLCDLVSRGGNLLLDIGPEADGAIPDIMKDRLLAIGKWLGVHGEAIYGTRYAGRDCQWSDGLRPYQEYASYGQAYPLLETVGLEPRNGQAVKQCYFTRRGDTLYAILNGWPETAFEIRDIRVAPTTAVTLLGHTPALNYNAAGDRAVVTLPPLPAVERPSPAVLRITQAQLLPDSSVLPDVLRLFPGVRTNVVTGKTVALTVKAVDAWGQVISNYTGRVRVQTTDAAASFNGECLFRSSGQGTLTLNGVFNTPGLHSVTVTGVSGPAVAGTQSGICVTAPAVLVSQSRDVSCSPGNDAVFQVAAETTEPATVFQWWRAKGVNLLANPGFELPDTPPRPMASWSASASGSSKVSQSLTGALEGTAAGQLEVDDAGSYCAVGQTVMSVGGVYWFAMAAKRSQAPGGFQCTGAFDRPIAEFLGEQWTRYNYLRTATNRTLWIGRRAGESAGAIINLDAATLYALEAVTNATNATLAFPEATPADSGAYLLAASNSLGLVLSPPHVLRVSFPPAIELASPTNGQNVPLGESFQITAAASDPDGSVANVEFFEGANRLGEARVAPFLLSWTPTQFGRYCVWARATDSAGVTAVSAPVWMVVSSADVPQIVALPGGDNGFVFRLYGGPQGLWQVQRSADLHGWQNDTTLNHAGPVSELTIPIARQAPRQFFRAVRSAK